MREAQSKARCSQKGAAAPSAATQRWAAGEAGGERSSAAVGLPQSRDRPILEAGLRETRAGRSFPGV